MSSKPKSSEPKVQVLKGREGTPKSRSRRVYDIPLMHEFTAEDTVLEYLIKVLNIAVL